MEGYNGLRFSPVLHDNALSSEGEGGEVPNCDRYTNMANAALVSSPPSDVDRISSVDNDGLENLNLSPGGSSPSDSQPHITVSRVEGIRRYYNQKVFQSKLNNFSCTHENQAQNLLTTVPGRNAIAGV